MIAVDCPVLSLGAAYFTLDSRMLMNAKSLPAPRPAKSSARSLNRSQNCALDAKSRLLGGSGMMMPSLAMRALTVRNDSDGGVSQMITSYFDRMGSSP